MAEDGGRWLTWLLGTDPMHNDASKPAAGGIFRGECGAESVGGGAERYVHAL